MVIKGYFNSAGWLKLNYLLVLIIGWLNLLAEANRVAAGWLKIIFKRHGMAGKLADAYGRTVSTCKSTYISQKHNYGSYASHTIYSIIIEFS